MEVNVEDVSSRVNVVDSKSLLTPAVMATIVRTVLRAVEEREHHQKRVRSELNMDSNAYQE